MKRWSLLIIGLAGLLFLTAGILSVNDSSSPQSASTVFSREGTLAQSEPSTTEKEKLPSETTPTQSSTITEPSHSKSTTPIEQKSSSPESKTDAPLPVTPKADSKTSTPSSVKPISTVQYSIRGDQQLGVIFSGQVPVYSDDTVFTVLKRVTEKNKIAMEYQGIGSQTYVEGIANLYEFDRGQGSGWMYRVNGVFPNKSAGVFKIKPGDRVEWLYTLDLGKDLGADLK